MIRAIIAGLAVLAIEIGLAIVIFAVIFYKEV